MEPSLDPTFDPTSKPSRDPTLEPTLTGTPTQGKYFFVEKWALVPLSLSQNVFGVALHTDTAAYLKYIPKLFIRKWRDILQNSMCFEFGRRLVKTPRTCTDNTDSQYVW